MLLTSLLFLSCSDEQIINSTNNPLENATLGVKTKKVYPTLESNQILNVEDFDYNHLNKLQKKSYYGGNREFLYYYDEYSYDENGLLMKRLNYHSNINAPSGFILLKSITYSYSYGLLVSETVTAPEANFCDEFRYEYNDGLLILKSSYHNGSLEYKTVYKYQYGKLRNEILYDRTERIVYFIDYIYSHNILGETRHYTSNGDLSKRIGYSYSRNGKLIIENVEVIPIYSSTLSSVVRYEY